jgi:microcystin-dependent protein
MATPFLAEIKMFAGNFAPKGYALCDGQLMSISQNTALFSLLGTIYGGDGKSTFALPNLQGRAAMQSGQGPGLSQRDLGQTAGEQTVTLLTTQMPAHSHPANCVNNTTANQNSPANNFWATGGGRRGQNFYASTAGSSPQMNPQALPNTGGSLPHNNMPPYLVVNFIIALQGIYPPRS